MSNHLEQSPILLGVMQNTNDSSFPASTDSTQNPAHPSGAPQLPFHSSCGLNIADLTPLLAEGHKKVRPSSSRCLNRHAQKRPKKLDEEKVELPVFNNKFPVGIARYDDMALYASQQGFVSSFIVVNSASFCADWRAPKAADSLDSIRGVMLSYPIFKKGKFRQLLSDLNARLVVAIVDNVAEVPVHHLQVTDPNSPYFGEYVPHRPISIIMQSSGDLQERTLLLTEERWLIGRRKCSVFKGCIAPPYLVIAAIDCASGLTLRARILPVYLAEDRSTFSILRSGYERSAMGSIGTCGGVGFAPQNKEQLAQLQLALGHRWAGDLSAYPCLPDVVLFPPAGGLIVILEIYGLCGLKKYLEAKEIKEAKIRAILNLNKFTYLKIDKVHLSMKTPAERVIALLIKEWFDAKPGFLWRKRLV